MKIIAYLINFQTMMIEEEKTFNFPIIDPSINLCHKNDFSYRFITREFFQNYMIEKLSEKKGTPDFVAINKDNLNDKKYIEFKGINDGLRIDQILWFINNKDKEKYLIFLKQEDPVSKINNIDNNELQELIKKVRAKLPKTKQDPNIVPEVE